MEPLPLEGGPMSPDNHRDGSPQERPSRNIPRRERKLTISPKIRRNKNLEKLLEEDDSFHSESDLVAEMEGEKARYPGSEGWAPDEERLFEILFMRQSLPLMPSNWAIDLQRVTISAVAFETSEENPPIVFAHGKDFNATVILTRLIDLTANVRSKIQAGHERKAPRFIKNTLNKYINWAAKDGGYDHLRIVPNILVEMINTRLSREDIINRLITRMRDFARLQREFLREDRDPSFWDAIRPSILQPRKVKLEPQEGDDDINPLLTRARRLPTLSPFRLGLDELAADVRGVNGVRVKVEPGLKRRRPLPSPRSAEVDEVAQRGEERGKKRRRISESPTDRKVKRLRSQERDTPTASQQASPSPEASPSPKTSTLVPKIKYRRPPPVVYGMFIVRNSVLVMTVDASQGDDAYVTYHVPIYLDDSHQAVWNALTIAIVVCLARDELRTRLDDFDPLPVYDDSDPDA